MPCYITQTGSFLPGPAVGNDAIERFMGSLDGEEEVKRTVLKMNGIVSRHYAQDEHGNPTADVYEMACAAIRNCLSPTPGLSRPVSMLTAGTTYAPLAGPGLATILHDRLREDDYFHQSVEVSSHAGICTSAAAAMVNAIRAVEAGEHEAAVCVGAEHPSSALKESAIDPIDDRAEHASLRDSRWFMSVFLRFMLSDGAGAFLLESAPRDGSVSFKVDWTYSRSYAHETDLCMKVENDGIRLSQNLSVLNRYLIKSARKFTSEAMNRFNEDLATYKVVLPHLSSFFFRKRMEKVMREFNSDGRPVEYWTNLATAGNTGAASIYVMLDHFIQENNVRDGDRLILFVPESGQFNFAMVSLTAVVQ